VPIRRSPEDLQRAVPSSSQPVEARSEIVGVKAVALGVVDNHAQVIEVRPLGNHLGDDPRGPGDGHPLGLNPVSRCPLADLEDRVSAESSWRLDGEAMAVCRQVPQAEDLEGGATEDEGIGVQQPFARGVLGIEEEPGGVKVLMSVFGTSREAVDAPAGANKAAVVNRSVEGDVRDEGPCLSTSDIPLLSVCDVS